MVLRSTLTVAAMTVAILALSSCAGLRDRGNEDPSPTQEQTSPTPDAAWEPASHPCAPAGGYEDGCDVPGHEDRPFDVYVPASYDPAAAPMPVVLFLHGGGGNSGQTRATTCEGGDLDHETCLHNLGEREGFITVYPNGSASRLLPSLRTWNGGGGDGYLCTSGFACDNDVDEVAYFTALFDELEAQYRVDVSRVYVTGFSNGAAMTHRLGCEMADRVTAIAPVAGSNSFATAADCDPSRPIPVVYVHGTADPCWTYETSAAACLEQSDLPKAGAVEGVSAWVEANGCSAAPESTPLTNTTLDRTRTIQHAFGDCDGGVEVIHLEVDGMGHAYPGGNENSPGARLGGSTPRDWDVSLLWEMLAAHTI